MAGIDATFHRLKVVGFLHPFGNEDMACGQSAPLDFGRWRLAIRGPLIGPDHAAQFHAGLGLDMHMRARLRAGRHIHALAIPVELHAMVGTANPVLLVAAEIQRNPTVGAKLIEKTRKS